MRVIGYIDGMNFYEASKDKRWYLAGWCNWTQTLDAYCPGADISVRYFTTLYSGKAQERIRRQKLHLLAMEKVARAEVVYGACREHQLRCPACKARLKCTCVCDRHFTEKMTDVNIAIRLLADTIDDLSQSLPKTFFPLESQSTRRLRRLRSVPQLDRKSTRLNSSHANMSD